MQYGYSRDYRYCCFYSFNLENDQQFCCRQEAENNISNILCWDFSDELLNYSKTLQVNLDEKQKKIRRDLTSLPIVTIDPKTSKDFDDAICVIKNSDKTYKLYVSIADVAHYVRPDSVLDQEAFRRKNNKL